MGLLAKFTVQAILLILPKLIDVLVKKLQAQRANKELEKKNEKKGENYENANTDDAHGDFGRLP